MEWIRCWGEMQQPRGCSQTKAQLMLMAPRPCPRMSAMWLRNWMEELPSLAAQVAWVLSLGASVPTQAPALTGKLVPMPWQTPAHCRNAAWGFLARAVITTCSTSGEIVGICSRKDGGGTMVCLMAISLYDREKGDCH